MKIHIRWMLRRDMAEVLDIERSAFDFPWFEEELIRCLGQRNCIGMVAEHAERVVGFMIFELHKTRLHILKFAVAADCRRRGVGTLLVMKAKSKLFPDRRTKLTANVWENNTAAQLFFRHSGFLCVAIHPNTDAIAGELVEYCFEYQMLPDECEAARCIFHPAGVGTR